MTAVLHTLQPFGQHDTAEENLCLDNVRSTVDAELGRFLDAQASTAPDACLLPLIEVIRDFIAGGKRLRPLFCYCGWVASGGSPDAFAPARVGAALELFHSFALVHDDVMDASEMRRGSPTVHKLFEGRYPNEEDRHAAERFGTNAAILIGDVCLVWSEELLQQADTDDARLRTALPWINSMRTEVMAGQYLDVDDEDGPDALERAWRVILHKTATYTIERPLQIGAALAGGGDEILRGFSGFGRPLGEAFQLRDDLLGVFGDPTRTGKPSLDDLRGGKRTILIALTRQRADRRQRAIIDDLHGHPRLDENGAEALRHVIRETGAAEEVEQLVDQRNHEALDALESMPIAEPARRALEKLAAAATHRHR